MSEKDGETKKTEGNIIVIEKDDPHWTVKIETVESRTVPKTIIKVEGKCAHDEFISDGPLKAMVKSINEAYKNLFDGISKARQDY